MWLSEKHWACTRIPALPHALPSKGRATNLSITRSVGDRQGGVTREGQGSHRVVHEGAEGWERRVGDGI